VCLRDARAGERLSIAGSVMQVCTDTPRGHKIALRAHQCGEVVTKYGHGIGHAMVAIEAGTHVHTQNLRYAGFADAAVEEGEGSRPVAGNPQWWRRGDSSSAAFAAAWTMPSS